VKLLVVLPTMGVVLPAANAAAAQAQAPVETVQVNGEERSLQAEAAPQAEAQGKIEDAQAQTPAEEQKLLSVPGGKALGMSILGNQEAPKALVIVPWKRSDLGNALDVSTMLDDSRQPIDKEVFMRMLSYYEIRSEKAGSGSAPVTTNATQNATAASGRGR
jgi:hypothetical protein